MSKLYNKYNDIKIVGGGSAGWMTAATLIRTCKPGTKITLIESPNIATVGVGESTIGGISNWLELIGLNDPKRFIKHTDGTIKLSIRFENFYDVNDGGFHYPFGIPVTFGNRDGTNDWYYKKCFLPDTPVTDFADTNYSQMAMVNKNTLGENFPNFNYNKDKAYHFDATKFGLFLKDEVCIPEGVQHVLGDVTDVITDENNNVESVVLENGDKYEADLWIDCTGFKSLLLGKALGEKFIDFADVLPNNSAWATRLPYKDKEKEINLYTDCIAHNNGWVWKIPLWTRWGTGYVYSDKYISDENALEEFKQFIKDKDYSGVPVEELEFKKIKMRVGRHERMWVNNVVAIGLSAGFIEPLESNGLYSVHEFLRHLVAKIGGERDKYTEYDREEYNFLTSKMFDGFAAFVAMHYSLSNREDTPYWQDVQRRQWSQKWPVKEGNAFEDSFRRKRDGRWELSEGLQCIAPGMRWFVHDFHRIAQENCNSDKRHYHNSWDEVTTRLDSRRRDWEEQASKLKSTYEFLRDEFFEGKDDYK